MNAESKNVSLMMFPFCCCFNHSNGKIVQQQQKDANEAFVSGKFSANSTAHSSNSGNSVASYVDGNNVSVEHVPPRLIQALKQRREQNMCMLDPNGGSENCA